MHKLLLSLLLSLAAITTTYASDWLSRIDDDRRVCRLSIPGTHDACTGYGFVAQDTLAGNYIACTQQLDISAQWAVGVRAFDLRPDVLTTQHRWLGCVGPPTESTDFAEVRLRGTAVIIKNPEGLTLLNMFL